MTDDGYWSEVTELRLRIADLLADLSPAEWDADSLCAGWRIRDVAGHLSIVPTITTWQLMAAAPRGGFDMNRINTLVAVRHGSRPTAEIVQAIRAHATARRTARVLDVRNSLFDLIVHSQDIALPLGRDFGVRPAVTGRGLERVWSMGFPFKASQRLAGLALVANDTDWRVGEGPLVEGPALPLLLLLTGRTAAARPHLTGSGVDLLPR